MSKQSALDENEIRKALSVFKDGKLVEVRVHGQGKTISGYFTDPDRLVQELHRLEDGGHLNGANVFYTINRIKDECYGRKQRDTMLSVKTTTSDNDVVAYEWLLVDVDPERPADTSATDEQLNKAVQKAREVFKYLRARNFPDPVISHSGNGMHLQYSIALMNTPENKEVIKAALESLDVLFSDDDVKIDTAVFNPARICKLYGTRAQKGADTKKQPHRMSHIDYVPEPIRQVTRDQLKALAENTLPKIQKPASYNNYNPRQFDLREWLDRYGIGYKVKESGSYEKFILDCCPFDASHKAPDSMITRGRNGEIGFKCLHNSCAGKRWQDVRVLFEPDAYSHEYDSHIDDGYQAHKQNRDIETALDVIADLDGKVDTTKLDTPRYLTPKQISELPEQTADFIKTGIEGIDKKMRGLIRGGVSVLSGLRGGSKSTLLTEISLNVINDGGTVLFHSFEMKAQKVLNWFQLMAAGSWNVDPTSYEQWFKVRDGAKPKINEWLGDRLLIYDNNHGNNFEQIYHGLIQEIQLHHPDLIVLDNLMALDINNLARDNIYLAQTSFIQKVVILAKQSNAHIIVVAHPKKSDGFLRLNDISGTGNLANAVDNAFIVHRNNEDFKKLTGEAFKWKTDHPAYSGTNVIEIAKDREYGTQDYFIPLWYELQTKRLKNTANEEKHYGWEKAEDGFRQMTPDEEEKIGTVFEEV